jgi:hypothetical protein
MAVLIIWGSARLSPAPWDPRGVLTLGICPIRSLGWQLLDVFLEQQLIARDSLHRLEHMVL